MAAFFLAKNVIMTHNNNFVSISFGSILGVFNYVTTTGIIGGGLELLKVFLFGIIGGVGGFIGKMLIQKMIQKIKTSKQ